MSPRIFMQYKIALSDGSDGSCDVGKPPQYPPSHEHQPVKEGDGTKATGNGLHTSRQLKWVHYNIGLIFNSD